MKVKHQVIATVTITAIIAALAAILISYSIAESTSSENAEKEVVDSLISRRDITRKSIERYLTSLQSQIVSLAKSPLIRQSSQQLQQAFNDYPTQVVGGEGQLSRYYRDQFDARFRELNQNTSSEPERLLNKVSDAGRLLQRDYIAANRHPLGEKNQLSASNNDSDYDQLHQQLHPYLNDFLQKFGYYDIFIADPQQGNIVYSVFKELDFATSLKSGPYANTAIADVYRQALSLPEGQAAFADFKPYLPSYGAAAAFIATPVFNQNTLSGVLIFQMPIDKINAIMTNDQQWQEVGFGSSGESYLVGSDTLLRSESRFLIENKSAYLTGLKNAGLDSQLIREIELRNSAIGIQPISTSTVQLALNGQSGNDTITDYRGVEVLSAYTPVEFLGSRWALISEKDAAEAFAGVEQMTSRMTQSALLLAVVIIVVVAGVGVWIGGRVTAPIDSFIQQIRTIARERQLSAQFRDQGNDEFAELGQALNQLFSQLSDFFRHMQQTAETLSRNSTLMKDTTARTADQVHQQNAEVNSAATATTEVSASVAEVAGHAELASESMRNTRSRVKDSQAMSREARQTMYQLSENMHTAITNMEQLEQESQGIGAVLDVIQTIAEQTNLLALNAAIEAARAGEQGRGFAVVADEVRTLASRTAQSTDEIRDKIQSLQNQVSAVQQSMLSSHGETQNTMEKVESTANQMDEVSALIDQVEEMSAQIATAAEEQSAVTSEIDRNVTHVKDLSDGILEAASQIQNASGELDQVASDITQQIGQFRY